MLSLPPSMAGVPAQAPSTAAPSMGAKGAAGLGVGASQAGGAQAGDVQTGFDAQLAAASQTAPGSQTAARRSDEGRASPAATGTQATNQAPNTEAPAVPSAQADSDREGDAADIAAETGSSAQTTSQTTSQTEARPRPGVQISGRTGEGSQAPASPESGVPENGSNDGQTAKAPPAAANSNAASDAEPALAPGLSTKSDPNAGPAESPDTGAGAMSSAKPRVDGKSADAAVIAKTGAQALEPAPQQAGKQSGDLRGEQPGPHTGKQTGNQTGNQTGAAAALAAGDPSAVASSSPDMRKQDAKIAAEPSAQGLSGLKAEASAGEARPDIRADAPAAQRAAFGQARSDAARREGSDQSRGAQGEARPAAATPASGAQISAAPVPAASRPLAELIAMQLQPLAQGALMAQDGQAAGFDPLLSGEADAVMDPVQMRADIRADSLRTPGQAGQAARFTPHTVQHLAGRIAQTAADGGRTVDLRLDPAELGRVRVRLEMSADNSVRALLTAERPDTLAELQRTARDLVRALEDAGLDLAENGLEFSLSEGGDDEDSGSRSFTPVFVDSDTLTGDPAPSSAQPGPATLYGFALHARARLDVRI